MVRAATASTARFLRAVFILAISLTAASAFAADGQPPSKPNAAAPTARAAAPQPLAKPLWAELTPAQQLALAPLASEWDQLDNFRKNKWLAIGNRYGAMKPDEQQRVQERMRDWIKLTPEQRRTARESYVRAKKLGPDQKSAKWEQYQQLPEEEKKKLAADAAAKKNVATLPPPAAQGKQSKTIPPIKAAPKPVLEKSVTPQAASQSPLQQPAQPNSK